MILLRNKHHTIKKSVGIKCKLRLGIHTLLCFHFSQLLCLSLAFPQSQLLTLKHSIEFLIDLALNLAFRCALFATLLDI